MTDVTHRGYGKAAVNGMVNENPNEWTINMDITKEDLLDRGSAGGGIYDSHTELNGVTVSFKLYNFSGKMLKHALRGARSEVPAAAQSDIPVIAVEGGLAAVNGVIDKDQTVTVAHNGDTWAATTAYTVESGNPGDQDYVAASWVYAGTHLYKCTVAGTSGAAEPTWPTDGSTVTDGTVTWQDMGAFAAVKDTDFVVWSSGIFVNEGLGIPNGAPINVSYTSYPHEKVTVASDIGGLVRLDLEGGNKANGEPMVGMFPKCRPNPASVALIGDGFGDWTFEATVIKDTTQAAGDEYGWLRSGDQAII